MRKEVEKRVYEVFEKSVADIRKPEDVRNFISDLLTPTEKIMLSKRLAIAVLLEKDYNYRQISQVLKVSFQTIAAVSRQKAVGGHGYKAVADRIIEKEKTEKSLVELEESITKFFSHPYQHKKLTHHYASKKSDLDRDEI